MTTYNTGNPLGSSDPRDLYDNAENLDNFVNGEQPAYDDRLGRARKSWAGVEQDFADFLASSGYQFLGDYAAGITVTAYNQAIRDGGEFWRAAAGTELPYTTTGAGLPEGGAFVAVGDAALRQELVANTGAAMVGTSTGDNVDTALSQRVIYVGSVAELGDIDSPEAGTAAIVSGADAGNGIYAYSGSGWELQDLAPRNGEPANINEAALSTFNSPDHQSATSPENGKYWEFSTTVNGLENTPDTIKMADGRYANRVGGYKAQRLGVFKTSPRLGHRCGDFIYRKISQTEAELITDLSRYIPYTAADANDPNLTVGYVDWQKGNNDSGDGLSWATAKASIAAGVGLNTDILLIRGGFYNRVNRMMDFTVSKDRSVIAVGGPVIAGALATGTWTKTSGQTNVYQLDYASGLTNITHRVLDTAKINAQGAPSSYVSVADIATVEETPGSFYHTGTTTYVHAIGSRDLLIHGDELRLTQPVSVPTITFAGNYRLYFEGIEHWGGVASGTRLVSNGSEWPGSSFYNRGCAFNAVSGGETNGLSVTDIGICISENSEASANRRDGFNYHNYLAGSSVGVGIAPHFVEINCRAHGNGLGGSEGNNQGSTAHEDAVGFRISGDYSGHADGGCIVDIEGVRVYNVAISAKDSSVVGMLLAADGYNGSPAEWWIDGAKCSGNPAVANARGDIAVDGYFGILHMEDTDTEKPLSTRTFSDYVQAPDKDFG